MTDNNEEQQQIAQRRDKLKQWRETGAAFPTDFRRSHTTSQLADYADKNAEELAEMAITVTLAGRIMTRRIMGKASFCTIQDMGGKIQLYITRDTLAPDFYNLQFKKWDIGDIVGCHGVLFKTKVGELSVRVGDIRLLTKTLRPLPEKFHGLADTETIYRQRYLDLLMNDTSRQTFLMRSRIVAYIRQFFASRDFLEVETPMLHSLPGGANAKPFATHHNALDCELFLRIAPELHLKRLVVGGFERVFEINRNFRNEGLSTHHNPEFTMLEFYQAYAESSDMMDLTEVLLQELVREISGGSTLTYQDETYDFAQPFARMTVLEAILHYNKDLPASDLASRESAAKIATNLQIPIKDGYGLGKIQIEIFEKTAEHRLMSPTFITAYPVEVSPLAKRNAADPHTTDRFEFFVAGFEIANGFTELNDPEDQAARFKQQAQQKQDGDNEAMYFDNDYITALEHGMPPTAGEGIGIDRLAMLLTNAKSIKDVLLFPQMRTVQD